MADQQPDMRAGDGDRERVVADLREHFAEGRLSQDEFEERSTTAYQAKTFGELVPLTRDLPVRPAAAEPETPPEGERRATGDRLKQLWLPWFVVTAVCTLIYLLSSVGEGLGYFWPMWVAGPWGLVLLIATVSGRAAQEQHLEGRRRHEEYRQQRRQRRIDRWH